MKRHLPPNVYRTKGVLYFYRRPGPWVRLETQFPEGAPIPFALHQERERLLNAPQPVKGGRDVAAAIRAYKASRKYTSKALRTRQDYAKHLDFLADKLGGIEPKHIERRHVIAWRDAWGKANPHRANYRLRVLKIVLEYAIDMGLLPTNGNPAKGVSEIQYDKRERQPWPDDLIAAYRASATGKAALAFELLLGTGQRIGDVLAMRWSDVQDGGVWVRQSKTSAKLWIPLTPALRAALADAPRDGLTILTNHRGQPWSYRSAAQAIRKVRDQIGAEAYDIHALRYTAASEIAAAGGSDDEIAAVTGHKAGAMIVKYAGAARQRNRATAAQKRRK